MLKEMKKNCAPKSMGECAWRELRRGKLKSLEKCQPISKEKVIEERKREKIFTYQKVKEGWERKDKIKCSTISIKREFKEGEIFLKKNYIHFKGEGAWNKLFLLVKIYQKSEIKNEIIIGNFSHKKPN